VNLLLVAALLVAGAGCVLAGAAVLRRRSEDRRLGRLLAVDAGRPATLRSERYRLAGRPDLLRQRRDGSVVPIELKHRPAPRHGPFPSHVLQVAAYCLLVEETTGRTPPFGVLRYSDREIVVPFDGPLRAQLLSTIAAVAGPYDGRADPSPAKCAGCPWSPTCDASAAR
jgi:CRISPR-associated exonuclease Cas4